MPNSRRGRYIGDGLGHEARGAPPQSQETVPDASREPGASPHTPVLSEYLHHLEDEAVHLLDELGGQDDAQSMADEGTAAAADETPPAAPAVKNLWARISLGVWGYYFVVKFVLFELVLISLHPLENLLFAGFILIPVESSALVRVKGVFALMLALALFYYDSWLPDVGTVVSKAALLSDFSSAYLFELAGRFVSLPVIGLLFGACLLFRMMPSKVRTGALAATGALLLIQGALAPELRRMFPEDNAPIIAQMPDMNQILADFFKSEAKRTVLFTRPAEDAAPFDVVFIHICSLSWDDIAVVGLESHPLWKRFDILMTRFNTAASYSGPAVIHLLRATCGQQSHDKLYLPTFDNCYLMNSLRTAGFEPELALNHNGKFDDFLGQIKKYGRLDAPLMSQSGLLIAQNAFDDSPVYDDLDVLGRWLDRRKSSAASRVALFYNTASLHDGNHFPGTGSTPNTLKFYRARLARFLDEMEAFMQKLEDSDRRTVVVMIPEHGAALRGDKRQIAGLREIPTPSITLVPVGIRVAGGHLRHDAGPLEIDQPTSYLAISYILKRMLDKSPYSGGRVSPADYVANLPVTPFVAQNEQVTVAGYGGRYYLSRDMGKWEDYGEFNRSLVDH